MSQNRPLDGGQIQTITLAAAALRYILQNPGKTEVLKVLPTTAPLLLTNLCTFFSFQLKHVQKNR
jgi:hypothetical protein